MSVCEKTQTFPTPGAARAAMRMVPAKANGAVPCRVYRCRKHKGYHFTASVKIARKR